MNRIAMIVATEAEPVQENKFMTELLSDHGYDKVFYIQAGYWGGPHFFVDRKGNLVFSYLNGDCGGVPPEAWDQADLYEYQGTRKGVPFFAKTTVKRTEQKLIFCEDIHVLIDEDVLEVLEKCLENFRKRGKDMLLTIARAELGAGTVSVDPDNILSIVEVDAKANSYSCVITFRRPIYTISSSTALEKLEAIHTLQSRDRILERIEELKKAHEPSKEDVIIVHRYETNGEVRIPRTIYAYSEILEGKTRIRFTRGCEGPNILYTGMFVRETQNKIDAQL